MCERGKKERKLWELAKSMKVVAETLTIDVASNWTGGEYALPVPSLGSVFSNSRLDIHVLGRGFRWINPSMTTIHPSNSSTDRAYQVALIDSLRLGRSDATDLEFNCHLDTSSYLGRSYSPRTELIYFYQTGGWLLGQRTRSAEHDRDPHCTWRSGSGS